jgi:CO/xanthine dehydrogenase FAD-binding subunit
VKPAPFEMHRPRELAEVLSLLATHGEDAKLIAGGQTLVPLMNLRLAMPETVIDLGRVQGLAGVRREGDRLVVGAMTRQRALLDDPLVAECAPLLARAVPHIGHVQTRSRGTVGGSLAHADPAAELPLVMVTLDAEIIARSARGPRTIAAKDFFIDALTTDLAADEVIIEVHLPVAAPGTRASFREYARRHGDFAIVAAAVQCAGGAGAPGDLRIALGGVQATPYRCIKLAEAISANGFDPATAEADVRAELAALQPLSDLQASAEYRRDLAAVCLLEALVEAFES